MNFNNYIGIRFKEKGRTREGVDCWGLVYLFYLEQFCIELPDYLDDYSHIRDRRLGELINEQAAQRWERVYTPEPGALIILNMRGLPFHTGIVVDNRRMIHAQIGTQVAIEDYTGIRWKKRVLGFYRLKTA